MRIKKKLHNFNLLRAHRKRTALSQDEVAFLLGVKSGSKTSRYEQMDRLPEFKTALAYEAIFDCPVSQLFPALFSQIEKAVRKRAKELAEKTFTANSTALMSRKRQAIEKLLIKQKQNVTKKKENIGCVLGIAASTRGMGYAVMTENSVLIDWGVKAVKGGDKNERCLAHAANLILQYRPFLLAMERSKFSRSKARICELNSGIASLADEAEIEVKQLSRRDVNFEILKHNEGTKHALAEVLAQRYPEQLGFRLPKKRCEWTSESYQSDLFAAVALAQCGAGQLNPVGGSNA